MLLSLSGALAPGCRDAAPEPGAVAPAASAPSATAVDDAEPPAPTPTADEPVPTLTAVFVGDVASRLLASGAATPAPKAPAADSSPPADPPLALASAPPSARASEPADVAAPASPPMRAWVDAQPVPRTPYERPDDETWVLPDAPAQLIWRHPAPAAGLQVEIIEAKGRSWPSRVRIEPAGELRVATVTPLDPLPPGTDFRLVARVLAADGASLLWTEPLRVRRPEAPQAESSAP